MISVDFLGCYMWFNFFIYLYMYMPRSDGGGACALGFSGATPRPPVEPVERTCGAESLVLFITMNFIDFGNT